MSRHYFASASTVYSTRVCSSYICYVVALIACASSTFGNDCILSSFFSFILTSNKISFIYIYIYIYIYVKISPFLVSNKEFDFITLSLHMTYHTRTCIFITHHLPHTHMHIHYTMIYHTHTHMHIHYTSSTTHAHAYSIHNDTRTCIFITHDLPHTHTHTHMHIHYTSSTTHAHDIHSTMIYSYWHES
jgi:hypothetical protein